MKYVISRKRSSFGAPITLSDRESSEVVDFVSFEDESFIDMKEIDKGIQVSRNANPYQISCWFLYECT